MARLLIFAWEYYGFHSRGGTALSRRVAQVAESFANNGWQVTVVHKDQTGECGTKAYVVDEINVGKRISVRQTKNIDPTTIGNPVLRMAQTAYYVLLKGDRSAEWANDVMAIKNVVLADKPDLIISFFTPRAPLVLGKLFSGLASCPWIADLQDELREGISSQMLPACRIWSRKALSSAKAVVQVSPEWAAQDASFIGREVNCIRHAIPDVASLNFCRSDDGYFDVFYGGGLNIGSQSLAKLAEVLKRLKEKGTGSKLRLVLASNDATVKEFTDNVGKYIVIENKGWLRPDEYLKLLASCNCFLVIPWSVQPRKVIPSKFYELCAYKKPIWVVGTDTGAFDLLMQDWHHPKIETGNVDMQVQLMEDLLAGRGDGIFHIDKCSGKLIHVSDLYQEYMNVLNG